MDEIKFTDIDVLRVSNEPYRYWTESQVHEGLTLDPSAYLGFVSKAIDDLSNNRAWVELPPKQLFEQFPEPGDFRVMPCVFHRDGITHKTLKLVGTNLTQKTVPDQITVGKAFIIDKNENFVSHIFEACLLSSARTGACAALALKHLMPNAKSLAVIGAGRVGFYSALYAASLGNLKRVVFSDINEVVATSTAELLMKHVPDLDVSVADCDSLPVTDVLVLATTSQKAISTPNQHPVELVISLGADTDEQHELHESWLDDADIYVDTYDSASYGDLKYWIAQDWLHTQELTDFIDLIRNNEGKRPGKRKLFVSTGSALFDNITMAYLLEQTGDKA